MSRRSAQESRASPAQRLHSAAIRLLRTLRVEDAALGLTGPRLSALSVVVFGGPLRAGELARAEQVTPATISRLLAALEAEGLVARRPDPSDGRAILVEATAEGRRLLEEGRRRRVAALEARLQGLDEDDVAVLERAAALLEGVVAGPD